MNRKHFGIFLKRALWNLEVKLEMRFYCYAKYLIETKVQLNKKPLRFYCTIGNKLLCLKIYVKKVKISLLCSVLM